MAASVLSWSDLRKVFPEPHRRHIGSEGERAFTFWQANPGQSRWMRMSAAPMFERISNRLHSRSASLLGSLESRLDRIFQIWLLFAGLASAIRIAATPPAIAADSGVLPIVAPYVLLVLAPFASAVLALRWFRDGHLQPQPSTRLALVGKWRSVPAAEARRHCLYGTTGIMVSLLIGTLLNVPVRAAEYLVSMPPVAGQVPEWLSSLHFAMTFDVVLFTSLYAVAFVAALRKVPLFPRLLAAIWIADVTMQLVTAKLVGSAGNVPPQVADALHSLLYGNVEKVLISVAVWLPYLLLSKRVNVTYRHRIPA
jgi:hypothetical protein